MSPLFTSLLVVGGVSLFTATVLGRLRAISAMASVPGNRLDRLSERLGSLLKFGFGQRRMVDREELVPGVMHVLIFGAFLVLSLRTVSLFVMGYSEPALAVLTSLEHPAWADAPTWRAVYAAYLFLKDIVAVLALVGVGYFAYLRVVTKPARMTASNEALLILGFIGGLMVTELLFGASHLHRATPWEPVTSVVAALTGGDPTC